MLKKLALIGLALAAMTYVNVAFAHGGCHRNGLFRKGCCHSRHAVRLPLVKRGCCHKAACN